MDCCVHRPTLTAAVLLACLWAGAAPSAHAAAAGLRPDPERADDIRFEVEATAGDFPQLVTDQHDALLRPNGGCDALRSLRIDELAEPWRQVVERIHFSCDLVPSDGPAPVVATQSVAFVRAGTTRFAGLPVLEVRRMESRKWGDLEYILAGDYGSARAALRAAVVAQCLARNGIREAGESGPCRVEQRSEGLYLKSGGVAGIFVHGDEADPRRIVYAEAWGE